MKAAVLDPISGAPAMTSSKAEAALALHRFGMGPRAAGGVAAARALTTPRIL
jgi:hypothetical protein